MSAPRSSPISAPLISVILPMRELSEHANQAVQSILNQTHHNLEIVLVGQSSVFNEAKHLPADDRIKPIVREAPGIVGALNTGLKHCTGDYIARMDADDIALDRRLALQLQMAIQTDNQALLSTRVEFFAQDTPPGKGNVRYANWLNSLSDVTALYNACMIESPMPHPGFFAHRNVWEKVGSYRDLGWPEDYDFILRAWLKQIPMLKPEEVLLHWQDHPQRLTRTDKRYSREAFTRVKAWALTQNDSPSIYTINNGVWICGTGRNARYWHDALQEQSVKVMGFVDLDTANRRYQKRHLPVITYQQLGSSWKDELIITAITEPGARRKLISWFESINKKPWQDYVIGG